MTEQITAEGPTPLEFGELAGAPAVHRYGLAAGPPVAGKPVVVLQCVPQPRKGTSAFVEQITTHASADIEFKFATVSEMLFGTFDVVHLHWPELLVRSYYPVLTPLNVAVASLFALRLRAQGIPVVSTVHNIVPHEKVSFVGRLLLRRLDSLVRAYVKLNPFTPVPPSATAAVIPHGHYRDVVGVDSSVTPVARRIVSCGLIRKYKGVEVLLEAFGGLDDPEASLRITGCPYDRDLGRKIVVAAQADGRISADLRHVPDEVLTAEIRAAELVVLPYHHMHNSGVAFYALSLERPVLIPDNPVNRQLRDEVGADWVHLFSGALDATVLQETLGKVAAQKPSEPPRFRNREWKDIARQYAEIYREVAFTSGKVAARQ